MFELNMKGGMIGRLEPMTLLTCGVITACIGCAWVFCLEVLFQTFTTFKKYNSLYFWSIFITAFAILVYSVGVLWKLFGFTESEIAPACLVTFAWWPMVTGQSFVLYSRLNIVANDKKTMRLVLAMIITTAIIFDIPTTVLTLGSQTTQYQRFYKTWNIYEKIQMTGFAIQEAIIACLYIKFVRRRLKNTGIYDEPKARLVMMHLLWISFFIIFLDAVLIACEFASLYWVEASIKAFIYAYKLRIEFSILNRLVELVTTMKPSYGNSKQSKDQYTSHTQSHHTHPGKLDRHSRETGYSAGAWRNSGSPDTDVRDRPGITARTDVDVESSKDKSDDSLDRDFVEEVDQETDDVHKPVQ